MFLRLWIPAVIAFAALVPLPETNGCCPVGHSGKPVVNADQTVIIHWDPASKTQHFIRQANFKSAGDDFGFLIPSPTQPELAESGNEAFPTLLKWTEPEIIVQNRPSGGGGCGCVLGSKSQTAGVAKSIADPQVQVLDKKRVAGFDAVVLEAKSALALVDWLKAHDYAFSAEAQEWAKPYIAEGWKITALKVAKTDPTQPTVAAGALRMSFKTEKPLFPYREPNPETAAKELDAKRRLLRIYFLADTRYAGTLSNATPWSGTTAWAGELTPVKRTEILEQLKLPVTSGPEALWLTEFEDNWAYKAAPGDVHFSQAADQSTVKRDPIIRYVSNTQPGEVAFFAVACLAVGAGFMYRRR